MNKLYIFLCVILMVILYFRKIDILTVGSICFIIYHIYGFGNELFIHSRERAEYYLYVSRISASLHIILCLQILVLIFAILIYDFRKQKKELFNTHKLYNRDKHPIEIEKTFFILGIICLLYYLANVLNIGFSKLSGDKAEVWSETGLFYVSSLWGAMGLYTFALINNKKKYYFIALIPVLIHLFIGSRAYFATIAITTLLVYGKSIGNRFFKKNRLIFLSAITFILIMAYKTFWLDIKALDFNSVYRKLKDIETYKFVFRLGEPRIVLSNYNYIIETGFKLTFHDVVARIATFIPFLNRFIYAPNGLLLSKVIQNQFNAKYGLASSLWGEAYAIGGYIGIFVFFIIWIIIITRADKMIEKPSWYSYILIPYFVYLAFYAHRMDIMKIIGNFKMVIFIMFLFWFINSFITRKWYIQIPIGGKKFVKKDL